MYISTISEMIFSGGGKPKLTFTDLQIQLPLRESLRKPLVRNMTISQSM